MTPAQIDRLIESVSRSLAIDSDPPWLTFAQAPSLADGYPYRTHEQHRQIRDMMRWYALHHPFAAAAIEVRCSYVVGSGHSYRVVPRSDVSVDARDLARALDELHRWMDRDRWMIRQREIQYRLDRDGEVFLRLFEADGQVSVRLIEPEHVVPPQGAGPQDAYGVRVSATDAETVEGYWIARPPASLGTLVGTPELIPADQVQHRKMNVDRLAPRGLPVLWPCRESLRRSWQILRAMSTVASIQASVAAVVRRAMGQSITPWVQPGSPGTGKDAEGRTYQHLPPGAIMHLAPGEEWDAPANRIDVANYVAAVQAELRAVAARLCMPEYMLSGDAANANYASTMVAEGPAVKMFERLQSEMIWYDVEILTRVLRAAERAGRLPAGLTDVVRIEAEPPMVMSRNRLMEAQADQVLLSMGVVSRETVAARHGYDWSIERERIEAEGGPAGGGSPSGDGLIPPLDG
jgi:capsid protein